MDSKLKEHYCSFYVILILGGCMLVAVDKNTYKIEKKEGIDYIYVFDDEKLDDLLKLKMKCINKKYIEYVDINLTDYDIYCKKKTTINDKDMYNVVDKDYKIGIIIPNYNYEHTIEKCLTSILNQTYKNYEIIFVDDMSTDNSIDVAQTTYLKYCAKELKGQDPEWAELPKNFKLVRLKQKRLNGGARNEGYLHLSDDVDYVYYVDSDDWLVDENSLQKIVDKLKIKEPDVLFVGMNSYKDGIETTCFIPKYQDKYEAMQGWSGSCGKVIKKELAIKQECLYNEGTLKEDRNQHYKICINMKSYDLLKEPVYVWNRSNYKSVTTTREKIIWGTSTIRHYADTLQLYLTYKGQDKRLDSIMQERLISCREEMLSGNDRQF